MWEIIVAAPSCETEDASVYRHKDLLEKLQLEDPDKKWHQDIPQMEMELSIERNTFNCDQCSFSHIRQQALKEHVMLVHKAEKKSCEVCGKQFNSYSRLKEHIGIMHGGVRYQCDICGKELKKKKSLELHKASVHEGVRYPCSLCDYKATWPLNVQLHINKIHNKE